MSSAASTARQTSEPTLPRAPSTPTFIFDVTDPTYLGAHHGERLGLVEQLLGEDLDVLDGDRVDPPDHLVDAGKLVVQQLGLGDAGHARAGLLHAEHEAATQLSLAPLELLGADAARGQESHLGADHVEHVLHPVRDAPDADPEHAGV